MSRRYVARIITAVLLGSILAVQVRLDEYKTIRLGREAYLATQSARFTDVSTDAPAFWALFIGCVLVVAAVIVLYEAIVLAFTWTLRRVDAVLNREDKR